MPIYEYACGACGHKFEEWQKMSDPPVRTCPQCKKKKVEKLISQTAFQLKGGGWYSDLYSSSKPGGGDKGDKGDKGAEKASGTDASSSSGAKSDSGKSDSGKSDSGKDAKSPAKDAKKTTPKKVESRAA